MHKKDLKDVKIGVLYRLNAQYDLGPGPPFERPYYLENKTTNVILYKDYDLYLHYIDVKQTLNGFLVLETKNNPTIAKVLIGDKIGWTNNKVTASWDVQEEKHSNKLKICGTFMCSWEEI